MRTPIWLVASLSIAACERGGTSVLEMEAAAKDHTRQELGLAADVPLQATVWVGRGDEKEETVLCGTVRDERQGTPVRPKRFAATGDPIRWLIFEDAHAPMTRSQPDKFPEWQQLCGSSR